MLTNVSSGHYAQKFRPHDKLHLQLNGFDFQNGVYYYNVGEGPHRHWDDYREIGFISAGQGPTWRNAILGFNPGDVVAAYLKRQKGVGGYVGIGKVVERARPIREVVIDGKHILEHDLRVDMGKNQESDEFSEYVCPVEWAAAVDRKDAKWKSKSGLYTTQHVRASLDNQPDTIAFLEERFGVSLHDLADEHPASDSHDYSDYEPIAKDAVRILFDRTFSTQEATLLRRGGHGDMDTKWSYYYKDGWVSIHRGSGRCWARLRLRPGDGGFEVDEAWASPSAFAEAAVDSNEDYLGMIVDSILER
jgi:hypothetical protein